MDLERHSKAIRGPGPFHVKAVKAPGPQEKPSEICSDMEQVRSRNGGEPACGLSLFMILILRYLPNGNLYYDRFRDFL
jgi:hypothetical protein